MPDPADELLTYQHLVYLVAARVIRRMPPNVLYGDLVAAGMAGLWRHLATSPTRNEHYLRIRIRGEIVDWLRREDRLPRRLRAKGDTAPVVVGFDDLANPYDPSTEPKAIRAVERAMLSGAIERLEPRDQKVLIDIFVHDRKQKDIAIELGISEPRVTQICARAIERLRAMLVDPEDIDDAG